MLDNEGYLVKIFFQTKSTGKFNIDEKVYNLSFWKNLYTDIKINNSRVPLNNPIRINRKFYQIREYNPVENYLTLYLLENQTNLTGTLQGLYVDKNKLEDAFRHHGNSFPSSLDKTQYHVFYFWGHWCPPCLKSMPETCKTLNDLDDRFSIYNISYDSEYSVDNVQTITDITSNYEIPGLPILEYHSKTSISQSPIIKLLGNISYPSIIICDKNLKIVYRSDRNDKSLEEILSELEN